LLIGGNIALGGRYYNFVSTSGGDLSGLMGRLDFEAYAGPKFKLSDEMTLSLAGYVGLSPAIPGFTSVIGRDPTSDDVGGSQTEVLPGFLQGGLRLMFEF
jgi:hypothetical protein